MFSIVSKSIFAVKWYLQYFCCKQTSNIPNTIKAKNNSVEWSTRNVTNVSTNQLYLQGVHPPWKCHFIFFPLRENIPLFLQRISIEQRKTSFLLYKIMPMFLCMRFHSIATPSKLCYHL